MTQKNLWSLKDETYDKDKDNNFVLLSLRSLGRADLRSIPAGGSRKISHQKQVKEGLYDLVLAGNNTKIKASNVKVNTKVKVAAQSKPKKKPVTNQQKGVGKSALARPKGFEKKKWAALSVSQKQQVAATFKFVPKPKKVGVKPAQARSVSDNDPPQRKTDMTWMEGSEYATLEFS